MKIEWVDKLPSVIDIEAEDRAIHRILIEELPDKRNTILDICEALVEVNSKHIFTEREISSKTLDLFDDWALNLCVVENTELMDHFVYFLINYPLVRCRVLLRKTAELALESAVANMVKDAIDELDEFGF